MQNFLAQSAVDTTLKLFLLLILLLVLRRGLRVVLIGLARHLEGRVQEVDRRRRLDTLLRAGYGVAAFVLILIAATMALGVIGLNITPLLTGAGVLGLVVSLGAQTLIKDYLGGIVILAEDQFRVGDVVEVAGMGGEVVRMTLRATYLRDAPGKLYAVPNGDIRIIANLTREWARAVVDLNLDYGADLGRAEAALQLAAVQLQADPEVKSLLIGPLDRFMWNDMTGRAQQVRLMVRTFSDQQFLVTRKLRRYAIEALQAENLHLALPVTLVRNFPADV